MNPSAWILWGAVSTVVLTAVMAGTQGAGLTRMSIPYMLGTLFTPDRDKAKTLGFVVHVALGLLFSLVYLAAFHTWGVASWWRGALIGLVHAVFVLTVGMKFLPGIHPRMATEQRGPTVMRGLEPPGMLALNYGVNTPLSVTVAHLLYGASLGAFYRW